VTVDIAETSVALLEALRRDTGVADLKYGAEPVPLGGGFWAQILAFCLDGATPPFAGDLVAKITPSQVHGEREALVQAAVSAQGYPAPAVLARGAGPQRADGCYFVMPKVDGAPPLSAATPAALIRAVPSLALRLPGLLADLAVRLHRLDAAPLHKELQPHPGWPVDVDDLVIDIAAATVALADRELADDINELLAARPNSESRLVICHGDFHPLNIIMGPAGATVVDWTAARLGPPAFDVAFTALLLAHPPIQVGPALAHPLRIAGRWLARRFVAGYRRQARAAGWELPAEEFSWYTRLHAARILLDAATLGDRLEHHPYAMLTGPASNLVRGDVAHHLSAWPVAAESAPDCVGIGRARTRRSHRDVESPLHRHGCR
jgi:aminoglycoside phosphotransferase (APT) family kinase protein